MDAFLDAVAQSLANAGPEYVTALGLVAIGAWVVSKALPLYSTHQDKRLGIEQQREKRKADEERSREQRDRERSEMEGRWLTQYEHATHVQEQTNAVMEGVRAQMNTLNVTLQDSKERSADMAREVREIHEAVIER